MIRLVSPSSHLGWGWCNSTMWCASIGLTTSDPQKLDFGMDVVLRIVPFYVDNDGNEIMTFAFAPVGAQNSEER